MRRYKLRPGEDPCVAQAEASGFRDLLRPPAGAGSDKPRPSDSPIVFELATVDHAAALRSLADDAGWRIPPVYLDRVRDFPRASAFATATLDEAQYADLIAGQHRARVRRWSLQLPLIPGRPVPAEPVAAVARPLPARLPGGVRRTTVGGTEMLALIDSGCPFARSDLQHAGACRIAHLWDQDAHPAFGPLGSAAPTAFGYGREVDRARLEAWMARHRDAAGAVDEAACYRNAGYGLMAHGFQHAAAVLGLLAGPASAIVRHPADPDALPVWREPPSRATMADIVFVQIPRDCVQDSTSGSLARHLLDGLRYVVGRKGPSVTRIVVNISDGTSRCAHDGRSIIELAMLALVDDLAGWTPRVDLELVVAAGNAFSDRRHARCVLDAASPRQSLTLRLPPGSEMPNVLTLAIPARADGSSLEIALLPPVSGSRPAPARAGEMRAWPSARDAVAWVVFPPPLDGEPAVASITWAPTACYDPSRPIAPAGDWVIELRAHELGVHESFAVDLWISRNDRNPGGVARARSARLVDVDGRYDPCRAQRACEDDPGPPRSSVKRHGTLNGLATMPPSGGILVAGSRMVRQDRPSLYSSDGPVPGRRAGPDVYYPADFSRSLAGIRVSGSLSGQTFRAEGTSFAAPQAARDRINDLPAPPPPGSRRRCR